MDVISLMWCGCSSPEIVKNEPYGEKADVWALGCILYHMVSLQPPFYSTNMLSLATKVHMQSVAQTVQYSLSSNTSTRP